MKYLLLILTLFFTLGASAQSNEVILKISASGGAVGGLTQADKDSINNALVEKVDRYPDSSLMAITERQTLAILAARPIFVPSEYVTTASVEDAPWNIWVRQAFTQTTGQGTTPVNRQGFAIAADGQMRRVTVIATARDAGGNNFFMERKAVVINVGGTVQVLSNIITIPKPTTGTLAGCSVDIVGSGANVSIQTTGAAISFTWYITTIID